MMPEVKRHVVENMIYQVKGQFTYVNQPVEDGHDLTPIEFARVFMAQSITEAEQLAFEWVQQLHGEVGFFNILAIQQGEPIICYEFYEEVETIEEEF